MTPPCPRVRVRRPVSTRLMAGCGVVALATAALLTPGLADHPASADTLGSAQAQAAALATEVTHLQAETEAATESYDATSAALDAAVGAHLQAEQAADHAQLEAQRQSAAVAGEARALYESGGGLTTVASLMRSGDPGDLVDGIQGAERHADLLRDQTDAAVAAQDTADRHESQLAAAERHTSDLQADARTQADHVTALLAQQSALLSKANAQVKQLEQEEEKRRQIADEVAFLRKFELAQSLAGHGKGKLEQHGLTLAGTGDLSLSTAVTAPTNGSIPGTNQAAIDAVLATQSQAASGTAALALRAILTHLGAPYLWGGTGPTQFDCSGLTGAAYAAAGLVLPRTAAQQYQAGTHPALSDLRPGDLLFWADDPNDPATIHHVAMYAGGDLMVSTDHTGDVARIQPIWADGFAGVTRPDPTLAAAVPGPVWSPGNT